MTRASLFDVNALLALMDVDHQDTDRVHAWFADNREHGWATCAITENGFARILSQPRYPRPRSTAQAVELLDAARGANAHRFWAADVSALDACVIDRDQLLGPGQITDAYLLALAVAHGGRFVTFDRAVPIGAVAGATDEHLVVL